MQRCLYDLNSERCISPRGKCTKIALATSTPTTIRKRRRVVLIVNLKTTCQLIDRPNLNPVIGLYSQLDGYYATKGIRPSTWTARKLQEYLQLAKELYQLSDNDALQLLGFFKHNFGEACRHLHCDESRGHMDLDFDSAWRPSSKSISELPPMELFSRRTFFRNVDQLFIVNSNHLTNILPQQPLAKLYSDRYLRIQRTYLNGHIIWVGCLLPIQHAPIEVAALLLPSSPQNELNRCIELMAELDRYVGHLVMTSKSWDTPDDQRPVRRKPLSELTGQQ